MKNKADDAWQILRIQGEFTKGFDTFNNIDVPCVSVFGSARTKVGSKWYNEAIEFARSMAAEGFGIITGGGPGTMEAANKGAINFTGRSIGIGIELPFESGMNNHIEMGMECRYFFTRKVMFLKYSQAFAVFPGGLGTLDELFEAITLAQCGHNVKYPIVLIGREYWSGLIEWLRNTVLESEKMSAADFDLFRIVDSASEAKEKIMEFHNKEMTKPGYLGSDKTNF